MKPLMTTASLILACVVLAGAQCMQMDSLLRQHDFSAFEEFSFSQEGLWGGGSSLPFSEARIVREDDGTYTIEFTPTEQDPDSWTIWNDDTWATEDWDAYLFDTWYGIGDDWSFLLYPDTYDWVASDPVQRELTASEVNHMLEVFADVQTRTDFFIGMCIDPSVFTTLTWDAYQIDTVAGCDAGLFETLQPETGDRIEAMLADFYETSTAGA